jgi:hypothetical protein
MPSKQYNPAGHLCVLFKETEVVEFVSQKKPAGQIVHSAFPGAEKKPAPHSIGKMFPRPGQ